MSILAGYVMDFHEQRVWKEARFLALTLYRRSNGFPGRERSRDLTRRIQESCLLLLTTLVTAFDAGKTGVDPVFMRKAKRSVEQLEHLVRQAHADGFLTTAESRQLDEELEIVKKALHG